MKTLHANKDYVLHNGHVYIIGDKGKIDISMLVYEEKNGVRTVGTFHPDWNETIYKYTFRVIATTDNSIPGWVRPKVKHIDRSVFVKPVDVNIESNVYANDTYKWPTNKNGEKITLPPSQITPPGYNKHCKVTENAFKAGYNANPNQFTLEQLQNAICAAHHLGTQGEIFEITEQIVLEKLMHLALPETIQCDDNYENLKPIW